MAAITHLASNCWYAVAPSATLTDQPLPLPFAGHDFVLFRDCDGIPKAFSDRCPHRGARLSLGWNLGERVACWYHGIEIDGTGTVQNVPAVDSCPLEGRQCLRSYAVQEIRGAVFLWFGDALHPQPVRLTLPEQLGSPDWESMLCTAYWKCNWQYAVDNVMDPMHGAYLHAASHSMAEGDKQAEMRIRKTDTGILFEKVSQREVNFDWVEWGETGGLWMRLSIPYQKRFGPGGSFYIVGFATPIDDQHCEVFFWRCRKVEGWARDTWKFMYRNRLEGLHWDVLEQDREMLDGLKPGLEKYEMLYQHDAGVIRLRRYLAQQARQQLVELQAAGKL